MTRFGLKLAILLAELRAEVRIMKFNWLFLVAITSTVIACSGSGGITDEPTIPGNVIDNPPAGIPLVKDSFQQNDLTQDLYVQDGSGAKADILFVVDNSVSMSQEQVAVVDAANSAVNAILNSLPQASVHLGVITTNTFGTADVNYSSLGAPYFNANATLNEINGREIWCGDPADPLSGYWHAVGHSQLPSYCAFNWLRNGSLGMLVNGGALGDPTIPTTEKFITGLEVNAPEILTAMFRRGLAGHWLESSLWAISQYLRNTTDNIGFERADGLLDITIITDTQDASNRHNEGGLTDSRPAPDLLTSDPENPGWYEDPTTNFYNLLTTHKASPQLLGGINLIGAIPGLTTVSPTCQPEDFDTRVGSVMDKLSTDLGLVGIKGDICQLTSYSVIMQQVADKIISQLNKQFHLTPDQAYDEIVADTLQVSINSIPQNNTTYTYTPDQLLIILNSAPSIGDKVQAAYFASKTKGYQLSQVPQPNTIVVSVVNDDGSETVKSSSKWHYNATTNSIDFNNAADAPQVAKHFNVRYNLAGAGEL